MSTKPFSFSGMELLIAYSHNPCVKIRNQIVQLNSGLVRKVAYRVSRQCPEPYEDLEQIGYLGLIRAIERFNAYQGYAFSSFAVPYIRGEILHYLRDKSGGMRIPRRWQELYNKGRKLRKNMTNDLGQLPKEVDIACALGISLEEWSECQLAFQNRILISLDLSINQNTECVATIADTIPDSHYQTKQRIEEEKLQLKAAIEQLDDKSKAAIESVFLHQMSRKEAAKLIGISPMTITRHLKKGIEQLEEILHQKAA